MPTAAENKPVDPAKVMPIRFLLLDVDGVLTDGKIIYGSSGEELKHFNVKDGQGIRIWLETGHKVGVITGRTSTMTQKRCKELKIDHVVIGSHDKLPAYEKMLTTVGVTHEETMVIADDLMELPLLARAGFKVAVHDAVDEVREAADYVTRRVGGDGAVREAIDFVLKTQGKWDEVLARFRR